MSEHSTAVQSKNPGNVKPKDSISGDDLKAEWKQFSSKHGPFKKALKMFNELSQGYQQQDNKKSIGAIIGGAPALSGLHLMKMFITQGGECPRTWTPLSLKKNNSVTVSADRIDNTKPHSADNVILTTRALNEARGDIPIRDLQRWAKEQVKEYTPSLSEFNKIPGASDLAQSTKNRLRTAEHFKNLRAPTDERNVFADAVLLKVRGKWMLTCTFTKNIISYTPGEPSPESFAEAERQTRNFKIDMLS